MERKFFAMIGALLGALVLATAATVYTQTAFAARSSNNGGNGAVFGVGGANDGHGQGPQAVYTH